LEVRAVILIATVLLAACGRVSSRGNPEVVFVEDFESGTLAAWQDGVDPARHRIVTGPAPAGGRYLAATYPAGSDGGWLTRFLMPGHDAIHVSYDVRFPTGWQGGTKLIALYGSRTDDRWSALGKAGHCPDGADFFSTMLVTEQGGNPGPIRFYTYYPGMPAEPDRVTCWGRRGDGSETYASPLALGDGAWHRVELSVQLNTPGRADARQTFRVDGVEQGRWSGFSFRESDALRLNAVQLTFSVTGGVTTTQEVHVDNLVVRTTPP
jgi:hypothetical protein